jgi:hypothetical protein
MPKNKKHNSRFLVEKESLYETSDFAQSIPLPKRKRQMAIQKAKLAEQESYKKIIASNASVQIILPNDTEQTDPVETAPDQDKRIDS